MADGNIHDLVLKAISSIRKSRARPSLEVIFKFISRSKQNISTDDFTKNIHEMLKIGLIYNAPYNGKESYYININNKTVDNNTNTEDISESVDKLCMAVEKDILLSPQFDSIQISDKQSEMNTSPVLNQSMLHDIENFIKDRINETILPFIDNLESLMGSYENLLLERKEIDAENIKLKEQFNTISVNDSAIKTLKCENEFLKKEMQTKNEIIKILACEKKRNYPEHECQDFQKPTKTARVYNSSPPNIEISNRYDPLCNTNQYDLNNVVNTGQTLPPNNKREINFTNRRTTTIIGDSTIKNLKPKNVRDNLPTGEKVYIKSFNGATISQMYHYAIPSMEFNPDLVIMHVGTNDLRTDKTPKEIAMEIIDLSKSLSMSDNDYMISGITARNDKFGEKAIMVNEELKALCYENELNYIDNGNIIPRFHLSNDKLHLNDKGSYQLGTNFANAIRL